VGHTTIRVGIPLLAACLAGCAGTAAVRIATRTMAPNDVCALALIGGRLAPDASSGLGLDNGQGRVAHVWWPAGWSAHEDGNVVALVEPDGSIAAHVGDEISVGGGYGSDGWVRVCPTTKVRVIGTWPPPQPT
jgi:hypothetical protein